MWCWEIFNYANCKRRKKLIDKLVLEYEDEILHAVPLNTTNTISVTDKNYCHIILLIIMGLILVTIVSSWFYYYYTRYWLKKEPLMPY